MKNKLRESPVAMLYILLAGISIVFVIWWVIGVDFDITKKIPPTDTTRPYQESFYEKKGEWYYDLTVYTAIIGTSKDKSGIYTLEELKELYVVKSDCTVDNIDNKISKKPTDTRILEDLPAILEYQEESEQYKSLTNKEWVTHKEKQKIEKKASQHLERMKYLEKKNPGIRSIPEKLKINVIEKQDNTLLANIKPIFYLLAIWMIVIAAQKYKS